MVNNLRFDFDAPIYLGTADDAAQECHFSAEISLNFEITVLTILGFKTIIGAPFLWQSWATLIAVDQRIKLFDNLVEPRLGGRQDTFTLSDYFYQRKQDTKSLSNLTLRHNSLFRSESPGWVKLNWQNQIAPTTQVDPRIESVEKIFRELFIRDAEDEILDDTIRIATSHGFGSTYSRVARNRTDSLLNALGEKAFTNHFSRAFVEDFYLREDAYFSNLDSVLLRTSALYQAANGLAHQGSLFTTPKLFQKIPSYLPLTVLHRYSISPLNPYLFADVLGGIGVTKKSWNNLNDIQISRIINTQNPLKMFSELFKQYLIIKILDWHEYQTPINYSTAVKILRKELLYENKWDFLESISTLAGRKLDGFLAGIAIGGASTVVGLNPFSMASQTRFIVENSYKLIDGLPFFDLLRMRKSLKKQLDELKLL